MSDRVDVEPANGTVATDPLGSAAVRPWGTAEPPSGGGGAAAGVRVGARVRLAWLDRLRGLAIVGMIVSHGTRVLPVPEAAAAWALLATRPIMPIFPLVIGYLWRPGLRPRHAQLASAAIVTGLLAYYVGLAAPSILVVLALALPVVQLLYRVPVLGVALGLTQALAFPVGWAGYEVGYVVALILVGRLWGQAWDRGDLERQWAGRLPSFLGAVGRRPLTWYAGHLVALAALVWAGVA